MATIRLRSLSQAGIRRLARRGCQLPDAILHGKRSVRPHSRAVQGLAAAELLSEAFQLAWTGGCATGLRTRLRHVCDCLCASSPLCSGSATAFGGALPRCHGSRLLTLRLPLLSQASGSVFTIAGVPEGFHGSCLDLVSSPTGRSLCPAFRRLSFGRFRVSETPESPARADAQ